MGLNIPERFRVLRLPEHHLVGVKSVTFSTIRIYASYGIRAKTIAGFCSTDIETRESDIVLRPDSDPTDLGHEVGHHVLNGISTKDFAMVAKDYGRAVWQEPELLFNCGLSAYSLTDEEEFFADLYSVWAMRTPMYRKARFLVRELFPNTARVLDKLFEEGHDREIAG